MEPLAYLPAEADQVLISVNPKAGPGCGRTKVEQLASLLRDRGFGVDVLTNLDKVAELSRSLSAAGRLRALVGAGGDGTAAEILNRTPPGVPLAVLPLGTENLLARYIGLGRDVQTAADAITRGATVALDAGNANGRLFLLMVSCGFDAEVIDRLHQTRRGHIRHWTYAKPILGAIRNYEYPELRIHCEPGSPGECPAIPTARWMFLFNLPCYAFGLNLSPDAVGNDGLLDFCTFRQGSFWRGLQYLASVVRGGHQGLADHACGRVRRMRVEADVRVPYQLDGDPGGVLPLDVEVLPGRVTLVVPGAEPAEKVVLSNFEEALAEPSID